MYVTYSRREIEENQKHEFKPPNRRNDFITQIKIKKMPKNLEFS